MNERMNEQINKHITILEEFLWKKSELTNKIIFFSNNAINEL